MRALAVLAGIVGYILINKNKKPTSGKTTARIAASHATSIDDTLSLPGDNRFAAKRFSRRGASNRYIVQDLTNNSEPDIRGTALVNRY